MKLTTLSAEMKKRDALASKENPSSGLKELLTSPLVIRKIIKLVFHESFTMHLGGENPLLPKSPKGSGASLRC